MQVFTTIYLAETTEPLDAAAEEWTSSHWETHGLIEIKRLSLERIAMIENRNRFLEDIPEV